MNRLFLLMSRLSSAGTKRRACRCLSWQRRLRDWRGQPGEQRPGATTPEKLPVSRQIPNMWAPSPASHTPSTHITSPWWTWGGGHWCRSFQWILRRCRGRHGEPHPGGTTLERQLGTRWSPRSTHTCSRTWSRLKILWEPAEEDRTQTAEGSCAAERKTCCCWASAHSEFIFVKLCKTLSCVYVNDLAFVCWFVLLVFRFLPGPLMCEHFLDLLLKPKHLLNKIAFCS